MPEETILNHLRNLAQALGGLTQSAGQEERERFWDRFFGRKLSSGTYVVSLHEIGGLHTRVNTLIDQVQRLRSQAASMSPRKFQTLAREAL